MQSIYEQSGGTYHQNGDYLIPDIVLPEQSEASIGTWGRRHLRYILENRPVLYNSLLLQNTLWEYLEGIDTQARARLQSEMEYLLLFWISSCLISSTFSSGTPTTSARSAVRFQS